MPNNNLISVQKEKGNIFFEFCNGGNLNIFNKYILGKNALTEIHIQKIVKQIVEGLECLHKKGNIYGGFSLSNIFLDFNGKSGPVIGNNFSKFKKLYDEFLNSDDLVNFDVKLKYFISLYDIKQDMQINPDLKYFLAPELLNDLSKSFNSPRANMWSLGIITYVLLTNGKLPFKGENEKEIIKNIQKGEIQLQ